MERRKSVEGQDDCKEDEDHEGEDHKGGGQDDWKATFKGGGGNCQTCQGTHPERKACPNTAADAEYGFDSVKFAKEKRC